MNNRTNSKILILWIIIVISFLTTTLAEVEGERPERASAYTEQSSLSAAFQAREMRQFHEAGAAAWIPKGPFGVNSGGSIIGVGRFNCAAVDPKNDNIVFAGAGGGGVWKSIDGGQTWNDVFLNHDQSIGSIAIDPNNSNIIWVGGGENMYGGGSHTYPGTGVFKSIDGGVTWNHMGLDSIFYTSRIVVTNGNSNQIFVAAQGSVWGKNQDRGIFRSQDGGVTWTQVLGPRSAFIPATDDSTGATDVRVHPTIPTRVFASMFSAHRLPYQRFWGGPSSRVWRSDDGGTTWKLLGSAEGLPTADLGMNKMDFSWKNPNFWYMVYFTSANRMKAVYKSTNGGMNWTATSGQPNGAAMYSYYGHTFGEIRVNPSNGNDVAVLGLQSYCSENGGNSYSRCFSTGHVDHRGMSWAHNSEGTIYLAQDGGLSKTSTGPFGALATTGMGTTAANNLNAGLIYSLDVAPDNVNHIYAGFQDNGTMRSQDGGATWDLLIGGDGMQVRLDHGSPNIVFGGWQYGGFQRSTNRGNNFQQLSGYAGRKLWDAGIAIDRVNGFTYIGSQFVHRAPRGSGSFTRVSNDLSNGDHSVANYEMGTISALSAFNNVVFAGTDDGNVWVNRAGNSGQTWKRIRDGSIGSPGTGDRQYNGWVKLINPDFNVANGSVAFVAVSFWRWGHEYWKPSIYKLTNYGDGGMGSADWTDIQGDLPPVFTTNKVISDSRNNLFVATDYGVYYSTNQGVNWKWLGDRALPVVPVNDMVVHVASDQLFVGTFGKGVWATDISALTPTSIEHKVVKKSGQFIRSFPNPVSSGAKIEFKVGHDQLFDVAIYDFTGKMVRRLFKSDVKGNKTYKMYWNRNDDGGKKVKKGNYILRAFGNKSTLAQKISVQ